MGLAPVERTAMKFAALIFSTFVLFGATSAPAATVTNDVCVVVGAPGEDDYAAGFAAAAKKWQDNCVVAGANCTLIGLDDQKGADPEKNTIDRDKLHDWITQLSTDSTVPIWIVYLGHGTFDGKDARLNLRGVDVSAAELAEWLKPVTREIVFVDGGSASAPFINALSAPNRIIITATQTGQEVNYARFGEKFADAINDPTADIDQDGQVSVLEAFVTAEKRVQDFYTENDRMATEHALIDDNGDKRGTPASFFEGVRLVRQAQGNSAPDGDLARVTALVASPEERALTDADREFRAKCEKQIENLRQQKSKMAEADYYAQLEQVLRALAKIYVKQAAVPSAAAASGTTEAITPKP
jgi:hypothetical protein